MLWDFGFWSYLVGFIVVLVSFIYWYQKRHFGYWEAKGLFSIEPKFFYGNMKPIFTMEKHFIQFHKDFYREFKEKSGGKK